MRRFVVVGAFAFFSFLSCLATGIYPSGVGCFDYKMPSGRIKDTIKVFYYNTSVNFYR